MRNCPENEEVGIVEGNTKKFCALWSEGPVMVLLQPQRGAIPNKRNTVSNVATK